MALADCRYGHIVKYSSPAAHFNQEGDTSKGIPNEFLLS